MLCEKEIKLFIFIILCASSLLGMFYIQNSIYMKQIFYHPRASFQDKTNSSELYPEETVNESNTNKRLLLTVGVLSKLSDIERRMAIRSTWFTVCKNNMDKVVCKFFTDLPPKDQAYLNDEKEEYNDVEYMPYKG